MLVPATRKNTQNPRRTKGEKRGGKAEVQPKSKIPTPLTVPFGARLALLRRHGDSARVPQIHAHLDAGLLGRPHRELDRGPSRGIRGLATRQLRPGVQHLATREATEMTRNVMK